MQMFSGHEYLMIAIANAYGLDKKRWSDRIEWVMDNYRVLEHCDIDADEPILFRKYVRALRDADRGRKIGTPVGLDATSSGLQMMAAMSGCTKTAQAVNLVNTGEREDVYTAFSVQMGKLLNRSIDRKGLKQAIMTFFYGSTRVPEDVFGKKTPALKAFYQIMEEALPGAYELMQLFQRHWDSAAEFYSWVMPDGHTVKVPVTAVEKKKIEVDELDKATFLYQTTVRKAQSKGLSLAANITHSVDSYVLREMIRRASNQGFQLATVHDCFFSHPNNMNEVRRNYQEIMSEVNQLDLVNLILGQIGGSTDYQQKSPDLWQKILQSEYAIC